MPYNFTLNGDLSQMATQKVFLVKNGFDVGQLDVYPALKTEEEYLRAIKLIFEHRIEGWWNYKDDCKEIKIELLTRRKHRLCDELDEIETELAKLQEASSCP